ncbi:SusD/RagB family nutrient-binding outer membrane lipoprotein [Chitinophaga filiformis]|uniref:SusD/RagB family nutrient-binding outer membrane lipoprotein n=1 Tax=Chitinophaga filiformis TaxID=104663 RepID=UPI001F33817F|nr:SusD/RagB family nutrient-binding outer membrane lipoprotein [Chitinophaga filiformis]MCF6407962.1 SusD/RagB family nutrient-binding outer membrane lipoprotein [Chitinophaga filiformis]
MKLINKFGLGAAAVSLLLSSCTKNFEDLNRNPVVSPVATPQDLIVAAEYKIVDRDLDWFYDNYTYIMRWMQFGSTLPTSTNFPSLFTVSDRTNSIYGDFYKTIGRYTSEIKSVISKMPAEQQATYQNAQAIAQIIQVYAAWRVSDVNGSIPYTEALRGRDSSLFTPKYDNQATLFPIWENELKAAIATLTSGAANQVSYGNSDIFYSGDIAKWAKAANVLRLKLAMRQLKRSEAAARQIITDVLASSAGLFTSVEEEFKFISATTGFARGTNWNPDTGSPFAAPMGMVDFMYKNSDPRIRLFFRRNSYRETAIDSLVRGGALSSGTTYNPRRYVGAPCSQDARTNPAYVKLFGVKTYNVNIGGKVSQMTLDTVSLVQTRLFDLDQSDGATSGGAYSMPLMTYAEQCFILAELSEKGIIAQSAEEWYLKGVRASIKDYNAMASLAKVLEFSAVENEEVETYLASADIAYTGTQEQKLEKIGVQNYINHFKAPHEAWGAWKRTGYPKEGGILPLEPFFTNGVKNTIPRRWQLPIPSGTQENVPNYEAAIKDMQTTGEYGQPNDLTGRVWWDMQ